MFLRICRQCAKLSKSSISHFMFAAYCGALSSIHIEIPRNLILTVPTPISDFVDSGTLLSSKQLNIVKEFTNLVEKKHFSQFAVYFLLDFYWEKNYKLNFFIITKWQWDCVRLIQIITDFVSISLNNKWNVFVFVSLCHKFVYLLFVILLKHQIIFVYQNWMAHYKIRWKLI